MTATTELQAGRELDALVAERVLGCVRVHVSKFDGGVFGAPPDLIADGTLAADHGRVRLPCYSTNIDAAWDVVEAMLARGLYPDLVSSAGAVPGSVMWRCVVDSFVDPESGDDRWPVHAAADTAPLAICRAALAAVGQRDQSRDSVTAGAGTTPLQTAPTTPERRPNKGGEE